MSQIGVAERTLKNMARGAHLRLELNENSNFFSCLTSWSNGHLLLWLKRKEKAASLPPRKGMKERILQLSQGAGLLPGCKGTTGPPGMPGESWKEPVYGSACNYPQEPETKKVEELICFWHCKVSASLGPFLPPIKRAIKGGNISFASFIKWCLKTLKSLKYMKIAQQGRHFCPYTLPIWVQFLASHRVVSWHCQKWFAGVVKNQKQRGKNVSKRKFQRPSIR